MEEEKKEVTAETENVSSGETAGMTADAVELAKKVAGFVVVRIDKLTKGDWTEARVTKALDELAERGYLNKKDGRYQVLESMERIAGPARLSNDFKFGHKTLEDIRRELEAVPEIPVYVGEQAELKKEETKDSADKVVEEYNATMDMIAARYKGFRANQARLKAVMVPEHGIKIVKESTGEVFDRFAWPEMMTDENLGRLVAKIKRRCDCIAVGRLNFAQAR